MFVNDGSAETTGSGEYLLRYRRGKGVTGRLGGRRKFLHPVKAVAEGKNFLYLGKTYKGGNA